MPIISIVGTSGVGKSFLVKQLSSLTQWPAFFEGEEGTIPNEILENIFNQGNPINRWRFFMERYKKNLEHATLISNNLNINCFVDGGALLNAKAILSYEDIIYKKKLVELLTEYEHITPDFIILLTAHKKCLEHFIYMRSRNSEQNNKAIQRALKIQQTCSDLITKEKNAIIIDRSHLDFTKYDDVRFVFNNIKHKIYVTRTS